MGKKYCEVVGVVPEVVAWLLLLLWREFNRSREAVAMIFFRVEVERSSLHCSGSRCTCLPLILRRLMKIRVMRDERRKGVGVVEVGLALFFKQIFSTPFCSSSSKE